MKALTCPQETTVTQAVATGNFGPSLKEHVAECALCRGVLQTAIWMQGLAQNSEDAPNLSQAGLLWWRARLSEKQLRAERSQDFFDGVQIASAAVILFGVLVLFAWSWPLVQQWLAGVFRDEPSWLTVFSVPSVVLPVAAAFGLFVLALGYPFLVDE